MLRALRERGSAAAELVVMTPVLVAIALATVTAGQLYLDRQQLDDIARTAAESAVVSSSPAGASSAALATALAELHGSDLACSGFSETTETSTFQPGGEVRVTVRCTTLLPLLGVLGIHQEVTLGATASDSVEPYRAVGP